MTDKDFINFKAYPVKADFGGVLVDTRVNFDADYKMEGYAERHNHSAYEIHFISSGNGSLWIEDSKISLRNKTLYLLSPKIYHKFVVKEEERIERYSMQFDFHFIKKNDEDPLRDVIMKVKNAMDENKFLAALDRYDNFCIIKSIFNELTQQNIAYVQSVELLVKQVLINIFRTIYENSADYFTEIHAITQDERRIPKMEQFFHDHYKQSGIKIDDLARMLNLSVRQTQRLIKNLFNVSFKEKIIMTRIENAKHLLRTTTCSVDAIAESVGFRSVNYFYSVFKEKTGTTPKHFSNGVMFDKN